MTNETYALANGNKLLTLDGIYFDEDGFQNDLAGSQMVVEIDPAGRIWDPEIGCRIRINSEGHLQGDACIWSFSACDSDMQRIGAHI